MKITYVRRYISDMLHLEYEDIGIETIVHPDQSIDQAFRFLRDTVESIHQENNDYRDSQREERQQRARLIDQVRLAARLCVARLYDTSKLYDNAMKEEFSLWYAQFDKKELLEDFRLYDFWSVAWQDELSFLVDSCGDDQEILF